MAGTARRFPDRAGARTTNVGARAVACCSEWGMIQKKLSGKTPQRVVPVALGLAFLLTLLCGSEKAYRRGPEVRDPNGNDDTWVSRRAPRERPGDGPGSRVRWIHFPPQKDVTDNDWGPFLTDIENHLPECYGDKYSSDDPITHAHETTHGINSHLTDHYNHTGKSAYGFYVGDDRAVVLVEPKVKLSQVAAVIPKSVRGSRYKLYLKEQQKYFENHPLYVFDEWTAYTNGARVGIEQAERSTEGWDRRCDAVVGALELGIYSLGLARAVEQHDPEYLERYPQFREFLAHELRRSMAIYNRGIVMGPFRWDRRLEVNLVRGEDTRELRRTLDDLYGPDLTVEALLSPPEGLNWSHEPLLAAADAPPEETTSAKIVPGDIVGTIHDEADRAQPELEVVLLDAGGKTLSKTRTDADGQFRFKELTPGKYKVWAQKFSGARGEKVVLVSSGKKVKANFLVLR